MEVQSMDYLLDESAKNNLSLGQIVLREEVRETGASAESILEKLSRTWRVMKEAASAGIATDLKSVSGLTGGDAARYYNHIRNRKNLLGGMEAKAVAYALATSGYNAAMGVIAAAPTAGSAGILPGVLLAAQEEYGFQDRDALDALLTAGGVGAVTAARASISGAAGGCQAECGTASAMAAAAVCELEGASAQTAVDAAAFALMASMGLVCDPVRGLVEVPCVYRNVSGVANALTAADLALSGIECPLEADDVVDAMKTVGDAMPASLRETGEGGCAACRVRER